MDDVINCIDWASTKKDNGKERVKTTPLSSNWIARSVNEESFRLQIELEKLKSYTTKLTSLNRTQEEEEIMELRASKLLETWRSYVYKILYDVYRVYVDNSKRSSVGDKGLMLGYINISIKKYLSKVSFRVYKGSIYDLQLMGVYLEVDPIEDVELVLDKEHPMAVEYQRDIEMGRRGDLRDLKDVKNIQHPFYKETMARTSVGKDVEMGEYEVVDLSPGERLMRRGDIFEPIRIQIPPILWVNKIDWELWGFLIHRKMIYVYKDF